MRLRSSTPRIVSGENSSGSDIPGATSLSPVTPGGLLHLRRYTCAAIAAKPEFHGFPAKFLIGGRAAGRQATQAVNGTKIHGKRVCGLWPFSGHRDPQGRFRQRILAASVVQTARFDVAIPPVGSTGLFWLGSHRYQPYHFLRW